MKNNLLLLCLFLSFSAFSFENNDLEKAENTLNEILSDSSYKYSDNIETVDNKVNFPNFLERLINSLSKPVILIVVITVTFSIILCLIFLFKLINFNKKESLTSHKTERKKTAQDLLPEILKLINDGFYKESISMLISTLLLHYNNEKIIKLQNGITNREYIKNINDDNEKVFFSNIVFEGEKIVFSDSEIKKTECLSLYEKISNRII